MTQSHYGAPDPKPHVRSHSHNLSINSISSITEPTTPPTVAAGSKSYLWDSHKINTGVVLPLFDLNDQPRQLTTENLNNTGSDPVSSWRHSYNTGKIDKDYLAAIAKAPLSLITQDIPSLAKDQYGCRFLQKRIDQSIVTNVQARRSNFRIIFNEILPMFFELIIDPFGNYLIQRLIEYCSEKDLEFILESLSSDLCLISVNQHGTRALQKIIEKMNNEYQLSFLVKGLGPHIIQLIKDLNGNHVIQKILNKYPPEKCQFIYDSIIKNLMVVATHKHGCCVLQKCLNHVNSDQLSAFAEAILDYETFVRLVNDQFGNYVLQYLISINSIEVDCRLFQNLGRNGLSDLCNLKFSSNVIEKLLKNCYINEPVVRSFSELKFTIIRQIFSTDINKLINDPYGNYVAQTLIDVLVHPKVNYFVDTSVGTLELMPVIRSLLLDDEVSASNSNSLQVDIIRRWFGNCKIVSSFGKRIQLKIAMILNGNSKPVVQRRSTLLGLNNIASGIYNQQSLNLQRANNFAIATGLHKNSYPGISHRTYSQPLLDLTVQNNYNLRPEIYCGQHAPVPHIVERQRQGAPSNGMSVSKAPGFKHGQSGPFSVPSAGAYDSSYDFSVPSTASSRYVNGTPLHGRSQTPVSMSFNDIRSSNSDAVHAFNGGYSNGMNFNMPHGNSNNASVARMSSIPGQGTMNGHGRSSSYNAINFSTPW